MTFQNETKNIPILNVQVLTKVYGHEFTIFKKKIGRKVVGADKVTFTVE